MQIQVLKQMAEGSVFQSELGSGIGRLTSSVPSGATLHVELEIPHQLTWGRDIDASLHMQPSIFWEAETTTLIGRLEQIDPDAVWVIRLGNDLLMVEVVDEGAPTLPGCMVQIKTNSLFLYPYTL